jgi:hypothetical protein
MKKLIFYTVIILLIAGCGSSPKEVDKTNTLPPSILVLEMPKSDHSLDQAYELVSQTLLSTVANSVLVEAGYPKPCYSVFESVPNSEIQTVRCIENIPDDTLPSGFLLDSNGSWVPIYTASSPDARVHLMDIYVSTRFKKFFLLRYQDLERVPRIVVDHPVLLTDDVDLGKLLWILYEGVLNAGAKDLNIRW